MQDNTIVPLLNYVEKDGTTVHQDGATDGCLGVLVLFVLSFSLFTYFLCVDTKKLEF